MDFVNMSKEELEIFGFMSVYLYSLESNKNFIDQLERVAFHSDEANTDKDLKLFVKQYMVENDKLQNVCNLFVLKVNDQLNTLSIDTIKDVFIEAVFLPEELTEEHKYSIKAEKNGVYTNPDLYIKINNKNKINYLSLELKSTKTDKIPGSSAQQANPYEWTLFVKHGGKDSIEILSGLYANTITGKLPFPDRSPRPQVSFSELKKWNHNFRKHTSNDLIVEINTADFLDKASIIFDWKKAIVEDWVNYIKSNNKPKKWFDETQRMFVLEVIKYYEALNDNEKQTFIIKNKELLEQISPDFI